MNTDICNQCGVKVLEEGTLCEQCQEEKNIYNQKQKLDDLYDRVSELERIISNGYP